MVWIGRAIVSGAAVDSRGRVLVSVAVFHLLGRHRLLLVLWLIHG
jgi:hypothetical protein